MIVHDPSLCTSCGACIPGCYRENFFRSGNNTVRPKPGFEETCIRCGHCAAVCPSHALSLEGSSGAPFPGAPCAADQAERLLKTRRSVRKYTERMPTEEEIRRLLEIARYAPSGHNSQDFRFSVISGPEKVRTVGLIGIGFYRRLTRLLGSPWGKILVRIAAGKKKARMVEKLLPRLRAHVDLFDTQDTIQMTWDAPTMILIHGPAKQDSSVNSILAGAQIALAAPTLNLGTCILGVLREALEKNRKKLPSAGLSIPGDHTIHMILSLGEPDPKVAFRRLPPRKEPQAEWI